MPMMHNSDVTVMMAQIERLSNMLEDERNRVAEHSNQLAFLQAVSIAHPNSGTSNQPTTAQSHQVDDEPLTAPAIDTSANYFAESPYGDVYGALLHRLRQGKGVPDAGSTPFAALLFGGSKGEGSVLLGFTAEDITRMVWKAARVGYAALVAAVRGAFFFIGPVYFTFKILFFDLFGESTIATSTLAKGSAWAGGGSLGQRGVKASDRSRRAAVVKGASPNWSLLSKPPEAPKENDRDPRGGFLGVLIAIWRSVLSLLFGSPRLVVEPRDAFAEALNAPGGQQGLEGLKARVLAEGKHKPLTMGDVYDLSVLLSYQPSPN